ncbi:MAG TPA: SDR family oxidoreductase [Burkholderiales bacterium]|nr:SDR family oxidoreductase [Burkholderiales bacterium]
MTWTNDISQQNSKRAIVTGTGGLGYEIALALAGVGAEVILAGRNEQKGRASITSILQKYPNAKVRFSLLDLASLASVRAFSDRLLSENKPIHLLINNAGVMSPPTRQTTADGFELQFGVNYLGHFALTARLLPLLIQSKAPRVVNVSSLAHRSNKINFTNLQAERKYRAFACYGQSKLAMLMFAFELQRRSDENGWGLISTASHPGFARTDLVFNGPGVRSLTGKLYMFMRRFLSHSAADGALVTLFAATSPHAERAGYYGPSGFFEMRGPAKLAHVARHAKDVSIARKLWEISVDLAGVSWPGKA